MSFNSTLVQLKAIHVKHLRMKTQEFQFYLSSIKSKTYFKRNL